MINSETEVRAVLHNFQMHRNHLAVLLKCISRFSSFGPETETEVSTKLPGVTDAAIP